MSETVIASSPVDGGVGCWNLRSGAELLRHRTCASTPHGLVCVAGRFLAASQCRDKPSSPSAPIFFWSWDKAQVEVKSFPVEAIGPIVANSEGSYFVGGGVSGTIYLWELASGKLLRKWHGHYRSVTCLTFSDDESLLISGSEDGSVKVWPLITMFDDMAKADGSNLYRYKFIEHTLRVNDVVSGRGFCNSIVVSSSEDRTCKIWSLSEGTLLRSISFPSVIDAIAMDPGEHAFYAGARDGKIYITALNAEWSPNSNFGMFILGALYDHSKSIASLALSTDGVTLVSGSEDGTVRVWDIKTKHVIRVLKHAKGPVNNVVIVRRPLQSDSSAFSKAHNPHSKKRLNALPPPLSKYIDSTDGAVETRAVILPQPTLPECQRSRYCSSLVMMNQIKELRQSNTSGVVELELEKLRQECRRSMQTAQQWKKMYQDLQSLSVAELLKD